MFSFRIVFVMKRTQHVSFMSGREQVRRFGMRAAGSQSHLLFKGKRMVAARLKLIKKRS